MDTSIKELLQGLGTPTGTKVDVGPQTKPFQRRRLFSSPYAVTSGALESALEDQEEETTCKKQGKVNRIHAMSIKLIIHAIHWKTRKYPSTMGDKIYYLFTLFIVSSCNFEEDHPCMFYFCTLNMVYS